MALVGLVAIFSGVGSARADTSSLRTPTTTISTTAMDTGMDLATITGFPAASKDAEVATPAPADVAAAVESAAPAAPAEAPKAPKAPKAEKKIEDKIEDKVEDKKDEKKKKKAVGKAGLSYTEFWEMVGMDNVKKVEYCRDRMAVVATLRKVHDGKLVHRVMLPFDPDLFEYLLLNKVEVSVQPMTLWDMVSTGMARFVTPIVVCALLLKLVMRAIGKPQDDLSMPLAKEVNLADVSTTMKDIAGIDHVMEEIDELIDYLRDADRYMDMGARLPAGVLMVGPPGTGKTLLAKAIAGEAKVPFFSAAGSEFTEMFVGVGASRVRNLFEKAREKAPCIIFIDEFDAIGASRTLAVSGPGSMGNEEQTNTINQMLTEMDGFEDNKGIVVLAATNRPSVLDDALTRPGRFDRVLHLPFPGVEGREQILKVHARDKTIKGDVDWHMIARGCAGWTGADIMSLMNESAMLAIREGQEEVEEHHIVASLEKLKRDAITSGGNKVESTGGGSDQDIEDLDIMIKRSVCATEAGRALIGALTPYYDDLQRVTVFPNGEVSGHTLFVPQESQLESGIVTRGYLESQMVVAMAGRCAEKLLLGEDYVTGSSASYMRDATLVARQMVMRYGYSKKIGPVTLMSGGEQVYLHTDRSEVSVAPMAPETSQLVLNETMDLIRSAEAKAMYGLAQNLEILKALEAQLLDKRSMSGPEVKAMCEKMGAKPYTDATIQGFAFTKDGRLVVPPSKEELAAVAESGSGVVFNGLPGQGFSGESN